MIRLVVCAALAAIASAAAVAQSSRPVPRPPAISVTPEDGSAAPDGYAPRPQWPGQTGAPRPAKTAEYDVDTVVEGLAGAFCFSFLPDGRILVGDNGSILRRPPK